jgi:hypothetical protein
MSKRELTEIEAEKMAVAIGTYPAHADDRGPENEVIVDLFPAHPDDDGVSGSTMCRALARAAWAASPDDDGWRPISEAPRDGTWIEGLSPCSIQNDEIPGVYVSTCRWVKDEREVWEFDSPDTQKRRILDTSHWSDWENHTHFRPLPSPPKGDDHG